MPDESFLESDLTAVLRSGSDYLLRMEFKPELPRNTDSGREEFLCDVSSFANASGGHLLYGAGLGKNARVGLEKPSIENAVRWMNRAAQTGIAPQISGLRFKMVELPDGRYLLAVAVPKTWAGPHMVTYGDANRFYSRNASGRVLLDVAALRGAFALSETSGEKIREFRLDRINAILNRTLTVRLSEESKTVLHICPVVSFRPGFNVDLEQLETTKGMMPRPMEARGISHHYNFDGLITFSSIDKFAFSFVQVFRNGCLEAVESHLLEPRDGKKKIPGVSFEKEIISCGERLLALLRALDIDPPYVILLSVLGVRDYEMFAGPMRWQNSAHPIERDHLFMEEVIMEDETQDFSKIMRPIFNQLWNACGWSKSLNYDESGKWREPTG